VRATLRGLLALVLLAPALASAQSAVDVADLPPLPAASDEPSSSATVLAAATAEEDVVVGAAKREQSLGNVASAVTVITADRIRRFGYRTVSEAIAGVAGVYITDTRLTHQVGIRGVQVPGGFNSRILVLVDGATINEAWGAFAGVGYDGLVSIDDIARIEVIRGPVGAVYGTNAFFAILNIVTRGAAEGQRAWGRVGINAINGVVSTAGFATGSVDRQLRGSVLALERRGETSRVPEISPDPLASDGGRTLIASLVGSSGGSFAQIRAMRARRDSPFAPYDADPALDPTYELYNTQLLVEGGHARDVTDRLAASVRGYGNIYRYQDAIHYAADDRYIDIGDARTLGAEVRGRYEVLTGKLGVTAGAEANYTQTESQAYTEGDRQPTDPLVPLDFATVGVYTEVDGQPTSWLGFTTGVRYDHNSAITNGSRVSPRGALFLARPERYGLKLLYAEGFRNPSAFEGFFEDGVDFTDNPDIEPETNRRYEAVALAPPVAGRPTRASAFYWDAQNVIEQRPDPTDPSFLQFQNVGRYVTQGVELEASYRNSTGWYAFGGATFARVGSEGPGSPLTYGSVPNAPKVTAVGGLSTPRLFELVHVSTEVQVLSRRVTRSDDAGVPGPDSPAWTGLNVALYPPSHPGFHVTPGARNLLGTRDLTPAPGDYDRFPAGQPPVLVARIPGEGREVYVKVGVTY